MTVELKVLPSMVKLCKLQKDLWQFWKPGVENRGRLMQARVIRSLRFFGLLYATIGDQGKWTCCWGL